MDTVDIVKLIFPKILPSVSGCNDTIAAIAIKDAARTFAREADIVVETKIFNEEDAPEIIPEKADADGFIPLHLIERSSDRKNHTVTIKYSLLPTGSLFPKKIADKYFEAIASLALFYLANTPGKPWTNGEFAMFNYNKYRISLGDAIRDNSTNGAVFHARLKLEDM